MRPLKERVPKRVATHPRYLCARCDVQTVHLMQMVQHGIVVHQLNPGREGLKASQPSVTKR